MGLVDEQKAERRARILAAAQRLIAAHGFEGLTMRELARVSRVSVPTLYNLFGGKHALLLGELEQTFAAVAASLEHARGRTVADRVLAACEVHTREMLARPRYWRELVHVFLVSEETRTVRHQIEARYRALMEHVLRDAQAAGELVAWADPVAIAQQTYGSYVLATIAWGRGDLDDEEFRAVTILGQCLVLLGLARGRAATQFERRAREMQRTLGGDRPARTRTGA